MKTVFKNTFSLILPFTVLVIVPIVIEENWTVRWNTSAIMGVAIAIIGFIMTANTIIDFIKIGKGTLAPWSPTRKLVIRGLYRHVRNPMITGVLLMLIGETLVLRSINLLVWSACFVAINTVYFILSEEPGLEKRFGDEYRTYKKNVPRWIPRLTPYQPNDLSE